MSTFPYFAVLSQSVLGLLALVVYGVVLWLIYGCFEALPAEHRKLEPGLVWLMLIPCFGAIWMFFVLPGLAKSYQSYFQAKGSARDGRAAAARATPAMSAPSRWDRRLAAVCARCTLCRHARRRQRGLAFALVRRIEGRICPFCRAYARVYGRPAHAPPGDPPTRH